MKTKEEIITEIAVKKAIRKEIALQYNLTDATTWQAKRLEDRWNRCDEAISILEWVLNEVNAVPLSETQ